jgi:DNA-binding beta-propeller fold protein YncE
MTAALPHGTLQPGKKNSEQRLGMIPPRRSRVLALAAAVAAALLLCAGAARAQYLVTGNDETRSWDENGHPLIFTPGKDTVSVIDIRNRMEPRIVVSLSVANTIEGPPTNLAVTPDNRLALVADSLDWIAEGKSWKAVAAKKLAVIDLTLSPPRVTASLTLGARPSGMAIDRKGKLALVANRDDDSVSVLAIEGRTVKLANTVALSEQAAPALGASAVAITPDGKHALVTLSRADRVELLAIDGTKVSDTGYAMATGIGPFNVQITPDGALGLVANRGVGPSDGQADTIAVIDMRTGPPRVIDQIVVGDGPAGLAVSPAGGYAAALLLNGAASPKTAFYHHDHSLVALLRIEGKKVRKVAEAEIGTIAKGIAFSPDGRFLYVARFLAGDIAILRIQGTKLVQVGALNLPGHPASLRGDTP